MPTIHITSLWLICCITSKYYIIYVHYNAIYSFIHICRALHLFFHLYLQSSALGFLLAQKHFTNPLVAVPSAVSVVCMAVSVFLPLAQTYYFEYFHSLQALGLVFLFMNLLLTILLIQTFSFTAWWQWSCSLLEEQSNTCWWQGWLQGMRSLEPFFYLLFFFIGIGFF